jgi:AraC-like DNA-binding protein
MLLDDTVVAANYASLILRLCESHNIPMAKLIIGTGIDPHIFTSSNATITGKQFVQLVQNAYDLYGDPAFGVYAGKQITISTHGMVGFTLMTSSNLQDALAVILRYSRTVFSLMSFELSERDGLAVFAFDIPYNIGKIKPVMMDAFLVGFGSVINFILGGFDFSAKIRLQTQEQPHHIVLNELYDSAVDYGCEVNEICFDSSLLELRMAAADPQTTQLAQAQCEQLKRLSESKQTFSRQVRDKLFVHKKRLPKLDEAARLFNMHPRTMGRYLSKEGTSYQELLDEVRETLAMEYLADASILIEDIAYALNFGDTSSFYRAFKRWTGLTPSDQRKKLME